MRSDWGFSNTRPHGLSLPCEHMQASSVCIQHRYTVLCSLISLSQIRAADHWDYWASAVFTLGIYWIQPRQRRHLRVSLSVWSCTGSVRLREFQASGTGRIEPSVHRHITHGYLCLLPVWIRKKPLFLDTSWLKRHTREREGFVRGCEG